MLKGAIFDLDGVVVDTVPLHFRAWKKMFSEFGRKFSFSDYKQKVDGIPRLDGALAILTDVPVESVRAGAVRKQRYYRQYLKKGGVKAYASTIRLIEELRRNGIKVAVISASRNCRLILKKIKMIDKLNAVVSGQEITRGKPHPQVFLKALKKLRLKPSECVVFEDAVLGVEAGRAAGIFTIGIDRHKDRRRLKKANRVISDAGEITVAKLKRLVDR